MRNAESGNVLFYILIAVALLAALSFAVSSSNRGSTMALSDDKAKIYATEIIEYSNILTAATAQLRLRGCGEDEISFENDAVAGYTNAGAPSDNSCHIFHINGGGVQWRNPEAAWINSAHSGKTGYGEIFFAKSLCVYNVGTDSSTLCNDSGSDEELLLVVSWMNSTVCQQINELLGYDNAATIPNNVIGSLTGINDKFTGTYGGELEIGGTTYTELNGKTSGCYKETTAPIADSYHFFRVLIAR